MEKGIGWIFLNSANDIIRLEKQIDELKEYIKRLENRIELIYKDMGYIRENMANREDVDRLRELMATSKEVEKLWKLNFIYITAIIGLLATLLYYFLSK